MELGTSILANGKLARWLEICGDFQSSWGNGESLVWIESYGRSRGDASCNGGMCRERV